MKSFNELIPGNFYGLHFTDQNRVMFFEFLEIIVEYTDELEISIGKIFDFDIDSNKTNIHDDSKVQSFSYTLSKNRLCFLKEISGNDFNKLFYIYYSLKTLKTFTSINFIYDINGIKLNKYYFLSRKGFFRFFKPVRKVMDPYDHTAFAIDSKNYINITENFGADETYLYESIASEGNHHFWICYSDDDIIIELTRQEEYKTCRIFNKFEKLKNILLNKFLK